MADGNIVYQGIANEAPAYFSNVGFKFGKFSNPADIFMRVLAINYPKKKEDLEKLELLTSTYTSRQRNKVDSELIKNKIPDFDLLSKVRH
jgi:hypothetical protein